MPEVASFKVYHFIITMNTFLKVYCGLTASLNLKATAREMIQLTCINLFLCCVMMFVLMWILCQQNSHNPCGVGTAVDLLCDILLRETGLTQIFWFMRYHFVD